MSYRAALIALPLLLTPACSSAEEMERDFGVERANANAQAPAAPPASDLPDAGEGRSVEVENDTYAFAYSYPARAAATPDLRAALDARLEQARQEIDEQASEARADAEANNYEHRPHSLEVKWEVMAETPRLLSLLGNVYTYSGGAHPNSNFETLLWDKQAGKEVQPLALFTSPQALEQAVRSDYCTALEAERVSRSGLAARQGQELLDQCPKLADLAVFFTSIDGDVMDGIGLYAAPYVAGSYAEGPYEIVLPFNAAMMRAVKPQYRAAFAVPDVG